MKSLFLIRHAKSSWETAALSDFDRPLNARGMKDADEMAKRLAAKINTIDAFISSPALRAKTTAEKFAAAFGIDSKAIILEPGLYLSPESFYTPFISNIDNKFDAVAIFSHNSGITDFVNTLGSIKTDNIPTCGIFAVKAATNTWKEFPGVKKEFLFYDYPKRVS